MQAISKGIHPTPNKGCMGEACNDSPKHVYRVLSNHTELQIYWDVQIYNKRSIRCMVTQLYLTAVIYIHSALSGSKVTSITPVL